MKKIVFSLIVLIVVATAIFVAGRYWFGFKTEEQFRALLQELNQQGISITISEYERGFTRSRAETIVSMKIAPRSVGVDGTVSLPLQHTIIHGPLLLGKLPGFPPLKPFLAYVISKPVKPAVERDMVSSLFADIPLVQHTMVHLDGSGESQLRSKSFDKEINGDQQRVFLKMLETSVQMNFDSSMSRFSGSMQMDGLRLEAEDGKVRFHDMIFDFDMRKGDYGLTLVAVNTRLGEVSVISGSQGDQNLLVKGVSAYITSKVEGPVFFSRQQLVIEDMEVADYVLGPFEYILELRNLDATALGKIQKELTKVQTQLGVSNDTLQKGLLKLLPQLLIHSPEIEVNKAHVTTDYGDVDGRLLIRINNPSTTVGLFALLGALHVEIDVSVPEILLLKTVDKLMESSGKGSLVDVRDLVEQLTRNGFFKLENKSYSMSLFFQAGKLSINGVEIPLHDFLQKLRMAF